MIHIVTVGCVPEDLEKAEFICEKFKEAEIQCHVFAAEHITRKGLPETVKDTIRSGTAYVSIISNHSNTSIILPLEVEFAAGHGIPVFAYITDEITLSESFIPYIRETFKIPAYSASKETAFQDLLNKIRGLDKPEPAEDIIPNFSASPKNGPIPLKVEFTDKSKGTISGYEWDFGDGSISSEKNPSHTYSTPGSFSVRLTITHLDESAVIEKKNFIRARNRILPVAKFSADTTNGIAPLTVGFTDNSEGSPSSFSWSFGDGETSKEQSPRHTYRKSGTYMVTLSVVNEDGEHTRNMEGFIQVRDPAPPEPEFDIDIDHGTCPLKVRFTNKTKKTPATFLWDFGDSHTSSETNPVHTYEKPGHYTVTLTGENNEGSNIITRKNCITVREKILPEPFFSASLAEDGSLFAFRFQDESKGSPTSFFWEFGDNSTSTEQNPEHVYTKQGSYTIRLTVKNADGEKTLEKKDFITIKVRSPSDPAIPKEEPGKEHDGPVHYNYIRAENTHTIVYQQNRDPFHGVVETSTATRPIDTPVSEPKKKPASEPTPSLPLKIPPQPLFSADVTEGLSPLTVRFRDTSSGNPDAFLWDFGDGESAKVPNPVHTYTHPGTYTVTLTVSSSAGTTTLEQPGFITVKEVILPEPDFTADTPGGTAPLAVHFKDASSGSPFSYAWDFGDGGTSREKDPVHTYQEPGSYTVRLSVTSPFGTKTKEKQGFITVKPPSPPVRQEEPKPDPVKPPEPEKSPPGRRVPWIPVAIVAIVIIGVILLFAMPPSCSGIPGSTCNPTPTPTPTTPPTTVPTTIPTTIKTTIPTTSPTTIRTTIPTTIPTTVPVTSLPPSMSSGEALNWTVNKLGSSLYTVYFEPMNVQGGTYTYMWSFGDNKDSTSSTPVHDYGGAGSFTVTLVTKGPYGTNLKTRTIALSSEGVLSTS